MACSLTVEVDEGSDRAGGANGVIIAILNWLS